MIRSPTACAAFLLVGSSALAQSFELLSPSSSGGPADGPSTAVQVSADGRFVAFESSATNLVPLDSNGSVRDVFVRDRSSGTTMLVSRSTSGTQSNAASQLGGISGDGRFVTFLGNGLESSGADATPDIYVHDLQTGSTIELTPLFDGSSSYGVPRMGSNGRHVPILRHDTLSFCETRLSIHDRVTAQTTLIETHSTCYHAGSNITSFALSEDGTKLVYAVVSWIPTPAATVTLKRIQFPSLTPVTIYQSPLAWTAGLSVRAVSDDGKLTVLWKTDPWAGSATTGTLYQHDVPSGTLRPIAAGLLAGVTDGPVDVRISADKRFLSFVAADPNLVDPDTNGVSDAFLFDRSIEVLRRISVSAAEQEAAGATVALDFDSTWSAVFLASAESAWVPGDTNGVADIFRRTACFEHYFDGDLDGYGSPAGAQLQCLPPPAGWLLRAGDCDDTRASVNPQGLESCNGLDDDCDGTVDEGFAGAAYCVATPTAIGCVPVLQVSGCLSATQPAGCSLSLSGAPSDRPGMILYGFAPANQTWVPGNPSVLCVAAPRQRTTLQTTSTVNACGGEFSLDFPAWAALNPGALGLPLGAGQVVHFQGWLRDPGYPGGTMLTQAWKVTVSP